MHTILIQATPGVVPEGFCPTGEDAEQQRYNLYVTLTQWALAANQVFYNFGDTAPSPENRVYPWLRTVGGYPDRFYVNAGGLWLAKHPLPPDSTAIAPAAVASQLQVDTWDEGEAGAVGAYVGPFWEVDSDFTGRVPIGVGLVPGSDPALTLAVGDTPGTGSHALTQTELPAQFALTSTLTGHRTNKESLAPQWLAPGGSQMDHPTTPPTEVANFTFVNAGGGIAMSLLPPARARYIIKRTGRLYYRQALV